MGEAVDAFAPRREAPLADDWFAAEPLSTLPQLPAPLLDRAPLPDLQEDANSARCPRRRLPKAIAHACGVGVYTFL